MANKPAVDRIQIFKRAELFAGLSEEELAQVSRSFKSARFEPDETIFLEGETADSFHLVASGKVKVVQTSVEGLEVILHIFEPGGVLGALPTVGKETYPASAITLESVETYFINHQDFEELMQQHPRVARNLLHFATRMLQAAHRRLRELATERVERRIARTLVRLTTQLGEEKGDSLVIDAPLSRQDLADMSGTTLYTVSRTLKAWEREGILVARRKRVEILRAHKLIAIAEDLPEQASPEE
ncbi:MAG: Crp/Fnr family transcriptional regulator [Anaerolineales bacterium]